MTITIEEKKLLWIKIAESMAASQTNNEAWKAEIANFNEAELPSRINSDDPLEILATLFNYFILMSVGHTTKGDVDKGLAYWGKLHHLMYATEKLKSQYEARADGGRKRHQKTREIKMRITKSWEARQGKEKPKRAFARDILPSVLELADQLGHRFPDDIAALAFITKSLPKSTK